MGRLERVISTNRQEFDPIGRLAIRQASQVAIAPCVASENRRGLAPHRCQSGAQAGETMRPCGTGEAEERTHLRFVEGKIEDRDILGDALPVGRFRNGDDAWLLHLPAQEHLGRRLAVPLGDRRDLRVGENVAGASQGAIGGEGHPLLTASGDQPGLIEPWMVFALIGGHRFLRKRHRFRDQRSA